MSAPPPTFPSQENPDRRPLPEGYITRYDERYVVLYLFLIAYTLTDLVRLYISYAAWCVSTCPL